MKAQLTPPDLGLPDEYPSFRPVQLDAIEQIVGCEKPVFGAGLPMGSGKSLLAAAVAKILGAPKAIVLTATKGLQDQYSNDFGACGMVDIRGRQNYSCAHRRGDNCKQGLSNNCPMVGGCGCTYETKRDEARVADLVNTNYAYWIAGTKTDKGGIGRADLLILDEAHEAVEQLAGALRCTVYEADLEDCAISIDRSRIHDVNYWAALAPLSREAVTERSAQIRQRKKLGVRAGGELQELAEFAETWADIARMTSDDWLVQEIKGRDGSLRWEFDCIWPGKFAKSRLFYGASKVLLMSGTLRPIVMRMLGIARADYEFVEWPAVFPTANTPIMAVDAPRMNHKIDDAGLLRWLDAIDAIVDFRPDRRGIIHTVSYARQKFILENSRHRHRMIANTADPGSQTALEVVKRYREARHCVPILVSPSFGTGWNFPGWQCEWQIISKIPFPDMRSAVMQARSRMDPRYPGYLAMQQLVQAAWRGSRFPADRCEVFVVDGNAGWFMGQNRAMAPDWFRITRANDADIRCPKPRGPESARHAASVGL